MTACRGCLLGWPKIRTSLYSRFMAQFKPSDFDRGNPDAAMNVRLLCEDTGETHVTRGVYQWFAGKEPRTAVIEELRKELEAADIVTAKDIETQINTIEILFSLGE
jgi:hypothetical protein